MDTMVFPDDMTRDQKISSLKELVQIALVEMSDLKSEFNTFKNPKDDFYTVDEIAPILKVTKQSIYNKIPAGRARISIQPIY